MMFRRRLPIIALLVLASGVALAQWGWRSDNVGPIVRTEGRGSESGVEVDERTVKTPREIASHSTDTPTWTNTPGFEKDVLSFVRIIYKYGTGPRISRTASRWGWITDFPDSDLNLSFRVQQVTSMR